MENVDHLTTHDKGRTFKIVLEKLTNLRYKVVGVKIDSGGSICYDPKDFIRNSRNFGIPQNRPRVYIIGFDMDRYPDIVLPEKTPEKTDNVIYKDLNQLLDETVSEKFFMSQGYLETLEKHAVREKTKGNGFGYRIVNADNIKNPIANTILATGGSGKERNLIFDKKNGIKYAGKMYGQKQTPINNKYVRVMTPTEWGKLQGFVNYAFMDENKEKDLFKLPAEISDTQRYKLFGNSVTIPVIEQMAKFVLKQLNSLEKRKAK